MMKLDYNSPIIATFALACIAVVAVDTYSDWHVTAAYFTAPTAFDTTAALDYVRLVSHVLGHHDWTHLISHLVVVLLVGPSIEEKYGSISMLIMMLMTAALTALIHATFFSGEMLGASSIAFMLILVSSVPKLRQGRLPITVVLTVLLYLTPGFLLVTMLDSPAQLAPVIGGLCGSLFGFSFPSRERTELPPSGATPVAYL